MKIAVIADLHLGSHNNDLRYIQFQKNWLLNELYPCLSEKKVKTVVFLGDIFDSRVLISPLVLNEARNIFRKLSSEYDIHVILGNHDIYYRNTREVHSLEILKDQGVTVHEKITEVTLDSRKCLFIPWIVETEVDKLKSLLANNTYDIGFCHLEINGFLKNKGLIETSGLTQETFHNCKKVYSGHFHLKDRKEKIFYVGTPYELSWADYKSEKGFVILDTSDMKEEYIPSKNIPLHIKMKTKDLPLSDIKKEMIEDNFIDLEFHEGIKEEERINYTEKIEALNPISFIHAEEKDFSFSVDETIKTNLKDTLGSLIEYMQLVSIPDELDINVAVDKMKEIYNKSL